MKVLNLYSGLGGNRWLWPEHCEVTAVEHHADTAEYYAEQFPGDTVIVGDAHQYLLDHFSEYDFIWSSPPCPTHSKLAIANNRGAVRYPDMKLYQEIILLKHLYKGLYCVENVTPYYDLLIPAQKMSRHLFWMSSMVAPFDIKSPPNFDKASEDVLCEWLGMPRARKGIYQDGGHSVEKPYRNCVHPQLGLHIFKELTTKQDLFGDAA